MWSTATEAMEQLGAADHNTGACSKNLRPSPFFFRLASNAFPDIGSAGRIEKKKKLEKKSQEVSEQEALVPQDDVKR